MSLKLFFRRQGVYIYPWYISDLVITKDIKKITKHNISQVFLVFKQGTVEAYFDIDSGEKIGQQLLERIIKDKRFFKRVIDNINQKSAVMMSFVTKIEHLKRVEKLSNRQLLDIYSKYIKLSRELRLWGWVPVMLDGFSTSFLTNRILSKFTTFLQQKDLSTTNLASYYALLSSSDKVSSVQHEELARLELLLKISRLDKKMISAIKNNNRKKIKASPSYKYIEQHRQAFASLTYQDSGPAMCFSHLIKLMQANLKAGKLLEQKKKILNYYRELRKQQDKLIKELELPAELKYLFFVSSEMMSIKDYRKSIYQKSYLALDKIMGEIAKRLKLSLSEVKFLVYAELESALLRAKDQYAQLARQRSQLCCYRMKQGNIKIYQGTEAKTIIKNIEQKTKNPKYLQGKKLTGTIAFPGKVRGRVKLVMVPADIAKVNAGDILVSSATNPNLLLAMKKAAAFITDTGGIICHAAIVSRELKKPCIVGTQIASQVLHDGDRVEVDADRGIVRLLKS